MALDTAPRAQPRASLGTYGRTLPTAGGASTATRASGTTGWALRPNRPPRRHGRRFELLITVAVVALAALGARYAWSPSGPAHAPAEAAASAVEPGRASSGPQAPQARLVGPGTGASSSAQPTVMPPIAFSFAKFEADPALVAGAAATGAPNLSGESAIVVDVNSKDVLYAKQPRKRQLMASTTKIMTAIVAVEHAPLDKILVVPAEATELEPNHMGIRTGEKLTVQELLYGLLLDSGNDAAETIAFGVGGGGANGRAQFIRWMNEKAAALGMADSSYANASGLDDAKQYSTAYDLAVVGAYALGKPELRKVFATKDIVISSSKEPGHEHGWFNPGNLNSLLWSYNGAIGLKPGYTEDAGYTLVAAAERDGRTLVAVTLNSRRHFGDATLLLDFGFKH